MRPRLGDDAVVDGRFDMRASTRSAKGLRVLVAILVAAGGLATFAPPAGAHTPHDDIFDVAVSPQFSSDGTIISISRGLFLRSSDRGATWQRVVKGLDNRYQPYAVGFAGGSSTRVYGVSGDAVFRSDDGGVGWQRMMTAPTNDLRVLATTTASPDIAVVAGAGAGASITENAGSTWRSLGTFGASITAAAFKKASSQVIFVGDASGTLHSTGNAGQTWLDFPLAGAGSVTSIALSPSFATDGLALIGTSTGGVIRWNHNTKTATTVNVGLFDSRVTSVAYSANYAFDSTVFTSTWVGGLFVSHDRGSTWAASNQGLEWNGQTSTPDFADRPNFGRISTVLVDSITREQIVFLAGFTGLYSSIDLGTSWQWGETLSVSIVVGLALSPQYGTDHKLAITTYVNGALTSADGGSSWAPSNLGLAQPSFWAEGPDRFARLYNIAYSPVIDGRSWLYTSSAAGVLRSSNAGASWSLTAVAGFSDPGFDAETPRIPFVLASPGFATDRTVLLSDGGNGEVYRSTDEGATFSRVGAVPRLPKCLQASPTFATDHRIYACTSGGVYVSTDLGTTWTPTASLAVNGLAISVRTGVSETWLAATSSGLYRSTNQGTSWTRVTLPSPFPTSGSVLAVAASPPSTAAGTVLVTVKGRGLLRSTNGGTSFTAAASALLDANEQLDNFNYKATASPIVFSPAFSTDQTVFGFSNDHLLRSTDGGVSWQQVTFPRSLHTGPFPVLPSAPVIGTASASSGSASVAFTPSADGGSPVLQFDGTCTSTDGGATATGSGLTSPVVVSGLTNGRTYTCRVTATTGIGTSASSEASNTILPLGPPGAPTAATAVAGNGQATVSWVAPASDGGVPITGYVVTPYIGLYPLSPSTFPSTATSQVVTGLANGTAYRFKVAAINAVGTGATSTVSNLVTPTLTAPGVPTTVTAVAGNGQATVSWVAPASDGGSPITGYVVTPYVGFYPQPSTTFSSTVTSQIVTGLTNGTAYRFKVAAINAVGTGATSTVSNVVTPA